MQEIGWIIRLFLIISIIFLATEVNTAMMNGISIDVSQNHRRYMAQAASLQLLDNYSDKTEINNFKDKLTRSSTSQKCSIENKHAPPGFNKHPGYRLYAAEVGGCKSGVKFKNKVGGYIYTDNTYDRYHPLTLRLLEDKN